MSKIQQPSNQIKLTNVSIVRLKKGGKRFEIACYKNKVLEFRNGVETNLDDVLQISNVFTNVSKGEVAKSNDLEKAFGKGKSGDIEDIVKEILRKGDIQIGEKERSHDLSSIRKEIAALVSSKCVDPSTQKPYPQGLIEKAMNDIGYSVKSGKTAKSQVSEVIKLIQADGRLPIQRARMKIRVVIPIVDQDEEGKQEKLKEKVLGLAEVVESKEENENEWVTTMLIDPSQFRQINDMLQSECKGRWKADPVSLPGTHDNPT